MKRGRKVVLKRRTKAGSRSYLLESLLVTLEDKVTAKGPIRKYEINAAVLFFRTQYNALLEHEKWMRKGKRHERTL